MKPGMPGSGGGRGAAPGRGCASASAAPWPSRMPTPRPKKLIEQAYTIAEALGVAVWCEDEAGPYQTIPYPGASGQVVGQPVRQPHEYSQEGTAKLLTLLHPKTGEVRVQGVTNSRNETLHGWLKTELAMILMTLPEPTPVEDAEVNRALWERWREGLTVKPTLSADLLPLRLLLVMDNLAGHKSADWLVWCFQHGVLPLYTPLGGNWLNMAESVERILKHRALDGQYPQAVGTIIAWLEATAQGWNAHPTPFEWGGKRCERRRAARERRVHRLGGSGAYTRRPIRRSSKNGYLHAN